MTTQQAKQIPLDDFLLRLGHRPERTVSGELWYCSPLRVERTASFKLSRNRLAWYDHGEGVGGNLLDLAMQLGSASISDALAYIEGVLGAGYAPLREQASVPVATEASYHLLKEADYTLYEGTGLSPASVYLKKRRGIDAARFAPYLRNVWFHHVRYPNQTQYGFGLPNVAGGFEIRTLYQGSWHKRSVGPKDVTVFRAMEGANAPWHVFYSLMDFGTYLTQDAPPMGAYHYLVVNSDRLVERAIEYLATEPPGYAVQYPHQDESGRRAEGRLETYLKEKGWEVRSRAYLYEGYKDWTQKREVELGLAGLS